MFIFNDIQLDIADVTNFVHPGSPLDDEASQRGTSVYLVERRIDMLPKPLTEGKPFSFSSSFLYLLNTFFYIKYCVVLWLISLGCLSSLILIVILQTYVLFGLMWKG